MRKILSIFLVVFLCLGLIACASAQTNGESDPAAGSARTYDMEVVAKFSGSDMVIYREPVTDVLYLCFKGYQEGGLTAMLDPETGLPMTYTNYLAQYSEMFLPETE